MVVMYPRSTARGFTAGGKIPGGAASWHRVRGSTVPDNVVGAGGTSGYAVAQKLMYQNFAGEPAFSDDSAYLYGTGQEGYIGMFRKIISGTSGTVLGNFIANTGTYNNPRSIDQAGGVLVASCSTGANQILALDATTLDYLSGWPVAQVGGAASHCCRTDGTWVFATVETNPGTLMCVRISDQSQKNFIAIGDDWSGEVYSLELDKTNKRLTIASSAGKVYFLDYSTLYAGSPSAPTLIAPTSDFGYYQKALPAGHRLWTSYGYAIATYNTATLGTPALIGGAFTYTASHAGSGYQFIQRDPVNNLLYAAWADDHAFTSGGIDVLQIGGNVPPAGILQQPNVSIGGSVASTYTINLAATAVGSALVVVINLWCNTGNYVTGSAVSTNNGDNFVEDTSSQGNNGASFYAAGSVWRCQSPTAGSTSVTVTMSGSGNTAFGGITAYEVYGLAASSLDGSPQISNSTSSPADLSLTTSASGGDVCFALFNIAQTTGAGPSGPGGAWGASAEGSIYSQVTSAIGTVTADWSWGGGTTLQGTFFILICYKSTGSSGFNADALLLQQTIPAWTQSGTVVVPTFIRLSPDGTKLAFGGTQEIGGYLLYDVDQCPSRRSRDTALYRPGQRGISRRVDESCRTRKHTSIP